MTKPNVAQVLAAYENKLKEVQTAVDSSIQSIVVDYTKTTGELSTAKIAKLALEETKKTEAITTSGQTVEEKAVALEAAQKAAAEAVAALKAAKKSHKQTAKSVKQSFNEAARNIKAEIKAQQKAAAQARKEALKIEQEKVAALRAEKRSATLAAAVGVVKYDIFVVKDTSVRIVNGTVAVGKALSSAFNTGFNSETGLKAPEFNIPLPTQAEVAAPTAEVKGPTPPQA